jgi:hypothetical protein
MLLMALVGCGGGDGDLTGDIDNGGGGNTSPDAVVITLSKSDGDLSSSNTVTVSATLTQGTSAISNKTVTFTLAVEGSAVLDPVSGTATTDANGVASINVQVSDMAGSVNVIASYDEITENISFDSVGDGNGDEPSGQVTFNISKSAGDLSAENDVVISASLVSNDTGEGIAGKLVTFTLNDPEIATFAPVSGTAVTDSSGIATITVEVTDIAGGVEVTAVTAIGSDTGTVKIGFTSLGDGSQGVIGEPKASTIRLFASSQQIASSGAQKIELTAIAKDENNNLLEGVTINFSATSGALAKVSVNGDAGSNVTGPDGKVAMILSTEAEPSNRVIFVSVVSGDVSDSLEIDVVGTTLTLTGSSALALNDETNYIVNVLDSDGNGVAKTDVSISLSGGDADIGLPDPATVTTDTEGQASIKVTGLSGGSNRVVVTALGASASQDVSVQADSFLFTNFSNGVDTVNPTLTPMIPDVSLIQSASVTLTWQRSGTPVVGKAVSYTTTRGDISEGIEAATDANGQVTISVTSSNAGIALVTFLGKDIDADIELTNQLKFEFYANTAATIIAQASPNSIGPNQQTSTVSVVVRDINDNLVKNQTVTFEVDDVSGGEIFPATAVTDSNGNASTVYTSNNTSAQNGIAIKATVSELPSVSDVVNLTVAERELFIALGTGNEIEELGTTDYVKEYSVFVTDADSKAVANVDLTISALPHKYYKGYWYPIFDGEEFVRWITRGADALEVSVGFTFPLTSPNLPARACNNEDINFNGILDVGEDLNNDLLVTPGNKVAAPSTITTDADGRAVVRLRYSQSYGEWLDVKLIASAKVNGSESSAQTIFNLPVSANDVNQEDITPPVAGVGLRGPFGLLNDCSKNIADDPNIDGT